MNDKQNALNQIVDVVVECCSFDINGTRSMTREQLLGKARNENLVMSRCILVHMILSAGFSVSTAAMLLSRSPQAIRHMMELGHQYIQTSRAFRLANAECTIKCRDIGQ